MTTQSTIVRFQLILFSFISLLCIQCKADCTSNAPWGTYVSSDNGLISYSGSAQKGAVIATLFWTVPYSFNCTNRSTIQLKWLNVSVAGRSNGLTFASDGSVQINPDLYLKLGIPQFGYWYGDGAATGIYQTPAINAQSLNQVLEIIYTGASGSTPSFNGAITADARISDTRCSVSISQNCLNINMRLNISVGFQSSNACAVSVQGSGGPTVPLPTVNTGNVAGTFVRVSNFSASINCSISTNAVMLLSGPAGSNGTRFANGNVSSAATPVYLAFSTANETTPSIRTDEPFKLPLSGGITNKWLFNVYIGSDSLSPTAGTVFVPVNWTVTYQ
ncbi:hypothetical protein KSF73_16475 [Burkholderiaceae bacterium DAT-1]|nr:hypothetical protein [Burkholderiaceae bacterium DAT-1]